MFPCSLFYKKIGGNLIGIIADSIAGIRKRAGISADCGTGNNIVANVAVVDGGGLRIKLQKIGIITTKGFEV